MKANTENNVESNKQNNKDSKTLENKKVKKITKITEKQEIGLHTIQETFAEETDEGKTKFYYGSLRSGQKLEYNGNLVVIGDVNAGAEIFATGNISIVGILRGVAHAGATGNTQATISAMGIISPQIRIANIVKEMEEHREIKREVASIIEGQILLSD